MKKLLITAALAITSFTSMATEVQVIDRFYAFDDVAFTEKSKDPFYQDHGTRVSKVVAKFSPNAHIIKGVAHNTSNLVNAINGIRSEGRVVVNMSFGSTDQVTCPKELTRIMNEATERGVIFVAAAGNKNSSTLTSPATCPNVIVVGAQEDNEITSYSNFSDDVTVYAPEPSLGFFSSTLKGTSFTAPVVTATIANWLDQDPTLTVEQIKEKLAQSSKNRIATFETLGVK